MNDNGQVNTYLPLLTAVLLVVLVLGTMFDSFVGGHEREKVCDKNDGSYFTEGGGLFGGATQHVCRVNGVDHLLLYEDGDWVFIE